MPVKIPNLQRNQPVAPTSQGQINVNVPSAARGIAQRGEALSNLTAQTGKLFQKFEDDAIDTEKLNAVGQYQRWYKIKLDGDSNAGITGLKHFEGNPTEKYNEFDEEAIKKQEEILSKSKLSERGKNVLKHALTNKHNSLYDIRLTSYGNQYSRYREQVLSGSVGLEKQSAVENMGFVKAGDESSLAPFNSTINNLRNLHISHGLKIGTAQEAEDGKYLFVGDDGVQKRVNLNSSVKHKIAKDIADTTFESINLLIKNKQVDQAKFVMDRYKDQLDPLNKAKLDKAFDDADIEVKSLEALGKMEGLSFPQQRSKINALPSKSAKQVKIKQEAMKFLDANERYRDNLQKRDSKEVYNTLAVEVLEKMNSSEPYDNLFQLEANPKYKNLIDRVTDVKQRKALIEMIDSPKASSEEVYSKNLELLRNGQYFGMSGPDLMTNTVGLSSSDKKFFRSQWTKQNTETEGQERAKVNWVSKQLFRMADGSGLIKKDRFGKLTKKSRKFMNELETDVLLEAEQIPKNLGVEGTTSWIKRIMLQKVKEKESARVPWLERLRGFITGDDNEPVKKPLPLPRDGKRPLVPAAPTASTGLNTLSSQERMKVFQAYKKAHNGQRPGTREELSKWYKEQGK